MIEVWACGLGTQSVTIGVLIAQGRLPKPDITLAVDTEREVKETFVYAEQHLFPLLSSVGIEVIVIKKSEYATCDILSTNGQHILLPVYTNLGKKANERPAKFSSFCSSEWKARVMDRKLRSLGVQKDRRWIGYSLDEHSRYGDNVKLGLHLTKFRYPLVFDIPMRREQCKRVIEDAGLPPAPKSRCKMCPNQGDQEWLDLKNNSPLEFADAVAFDYQLREEDPNVFLHESCVPLDEVDFASFFDRPHAERPCGSGYCMV